MQDFFSPLVKLFLTPSISTVRALVDILLVAYVAYRILALIRGTRAWRLVLGVLFFVILLVASQQLRLFTLHWLLDKATLLAPVALAILLLPELRQALEGFGRFGKGIERFVAVERSTEATSVEELVAAVAEMSAARMGALIIIEREAPMSEVVSSGVQINARVSAPLLGAIFYEGNPLHDGAVVVRGDTIIAAACRLPLSETTRLDPGLHMRHRAALGACEQFDCIAIVVSEERGTISTAMDGKMRRLLNHTELRTFLNRELRHVAGDDEEEKPRRGIFVKGRTYR